MAGHAVYSPQRQRHVEKKSILNGQGRLCRYSRQRKLNAEFDKKKDLEKNSIYSFYRVSQSKILIDATNPFQIKPWEYGEMKNSDEKVNIGAFRDVK